MITWQAARYGSRNYRKTRQSNRSQTAAAVQAIRMSVFRPLRPRGRAPIGTLTEVLRTCVTTGRSPSCPSPAVADG